MNIPITTTTYIKIQNIPISLKFPWASSQPITREANSSQPITREANSLTSINKEYFCLFLKFM